MSSDPIEVLRGVAEEMRHRRVNNGKHTSPTLGAWANQIDAALASLSAPKHKADDNMEAGAGHVQGSDADECPKCGDQLDYDKFSDAVSIGTFYFDVHITACPGCGYVHDDRTWVE